MPYEGEILVNDLPAGGTPDLADKVMMIDNETGNLKLFTAEQLGEIIGNRGDGLTNEIKEALLQLAMKVAYIDANGSEYYDDLYHALYNDVELTHIEAVFTQGGNTIYDTDTLEDLRQYLVVVAYYSDNTSSAVSTYTLSGTLIAGTSTITVTYLTQTTTFNVTVTANPLDQIAYGDKTYRDIFISENMCWIGNFEGTYNWDGDFHTLSNGDQYKEYSGTVTTTDTEYVSPTHSLKTFGTSAVRAFYKRPSTTKLVNGVKVLVGCCVKVTRYVGGTVGAVFNAPVNNAVDAGRASVAEVTEGFEPIAALASITATRSDFCCYIGVNGTGPNADGYIDCVVLTVVPGTMTDEEAQTLYENYISYIVGGAR